MRPKRLQVYCVTGTCSHAWVNASNVRARLNRPSKCTDGDAPYTRVRWKS